MRPIDADKLKANCDIMVGNTTIGRRDYVMLHEIDSAPTIDAVSVVRCKDCKWHTSDDECTSPHWDCEESIIYPQAYEFDFCSYGEGKSDGDNH